MKLSSILALAGPVAAVFRDDVSIVDWKLAFIGKPLHVSDFANRLAIISDTDSLTCLNSLGETSWRQTLSPSQVSSGVAMVDDVIVVGGDYLTGFNAANGVPLWTKPIVAESVYASHGKIVVNGEILMNASGDIESHQDVAEDLGTPLQIAGNAVTLNNGTLSWDDRGVLRLISPEGNTVYSRDEGLAHVKQSLFVPLTQEGDSNSARVIATSTQPPLDAMVSRILTHLGQIWTLVTFIVKQGPAMLVLPEKIKPQFGFDQTLVVLTEQGSLYGLNATTQGTVSWVYHDLDALQLHPDPQVKSQFLVRSGDGNTYVVNGEGDVTGILAEKLQPQPAESVEVAGNTIHSSLFDWTLELPGDVIVGHAAKDIHDHTGSVVVPTPSGDVLYKYLQPYQAVYASYFTEGRLLTLTLVDTVTGRILNTHAHTEPVLINEDWPFQITFGEYWFAYTHFDLDESQTMKITMAELYESSKLNTRVTSPDVDVWGDFSTPHVKLHSWILPSRNQPVYGMAVSSSPYGAAAREIILALEHQIVALPKSQLNNLDPAPILDVPQGGHLSHIYGIEKASKLVVGTTNSEFTYLLAAFGKYSDMFCTRVSPAGEVDRLSAQFPKLKLIVFVGLVCFTMFTLSPLARNKKLSLQWR